MRIRWDIAGAGLLLAGLVAARAATLDGYVAMVNDRVIFKDEVDARMAADPTLRSALGEGPRRDREEAFFKALDSLIEEALLLEEFKAKQGTIPAQMVEDRLHRMVADKFSNDRAAFEKTLSEQGMTVDDLKETIRDSLAVSAIRRQLITEFVKISPLQVHQLYESRLDRYRTPAKARLHLIALDHVEGAPSTATDLVARARGGADFAALAREFSKDPKAAEGGDWSWTDVESLRPEIKAALSGLSTGQVSDVIASGDQLYIVRLDESQPERVTPFGEVRADLEAEVRATETERLYRSLIERLRRKHLVQDFLRQE
jgi:peptidyl-prolyl cis-trans isomerase SurA